MDKILQIINEIAATSSRNDKEAILECNKDNELLKKIFKFVYDPFTLTGISEKKISKMVFIPIDNINYLSDMESAMEYLKNNNSGRDVNIASIQNFIHRHSGDRLIELLQQIFTKNLKIGVTDKTLNKIYGKDFIQSFSCMLAEKYFDNENKVTGEFILTTKLDGCRMVAIKESGTVKLFSRTGQPYEGLVEIEEELYKLPDNIVLDGELILRNDKGLNSADLFRETQKVVRKDGIKKNVEFHVFDALAAIAFKAGMDKTPCGARKGIIKAFINVANCQLIKYVEPLYVGDDKEVILKTLNDVVDKGHEGVMLNIADAPYETKRTKNLLKIKKFNDADVRVVDVLEGTNKNTGKLGAITIEFLHEGIIHRCNCGSGFNDEERIKYWNNPELLIGKIVTIGYFEISKNQDGGCGLRFPTWKGIIRFDKSEISMY